MSFRDELPDPRGADLSSLQVLRFDPEHSETVGCTDLFQGLEIARSISPESPVFPDGNAGDGLPSLMKALPEFLGGTFPKLRGEGEDQRMAESEFLDQTQFVLGMREQEGRLLRAKHLHRVGIKGDQHRNPSVFACGFGG